MLHFLYNLSGKFVEAFFNTIAGAPPLGGGGLSEGGNGAAKGVDWWWLDYPGGASAVSGWDQQEPASLWWGNHMFAEYARRTRKQRPVILARYGGLGQQRDGVGFSGDTFQVRRREGERRTR